MCSEHHTVFLCPRCEGPFYEGSVDLERCLLAQFRRRDCTIPERGCDKLFGARDLCDRCFNDEQNTRPPPPPPTQPQPRPGPQDNRPDGHRPPSDVSGDLPLPPNRPLNPNQPRRPWTGSYPPSYDSGSNSDWTGHSSRVSHGPLRIVRTKDEDGHPEISFPGIRPGIKVKKDRSGKLVQVRRKR